MSQKPAPSRPVPVPARVSGGLPWWLWLFMVVFGVFLITTLVRKAIPEDPQDLVQEGMVALENGDVAVIERSLRRLNDFPEYASEQKLLEGMLYLGKSKPLLAIPLLDKASQKPTVRIQALTQLGNACLQARQRVECIEAYETVLQEDKNANDARLSLAFVLKDMTSWEEALMHLTTLVERKFKPGVVNQLMADIYADMGQYAKATAAYEAALLADPADPTNATKASRLITCRMETGNLEGIEEFLIYVDVVGIRESARALALAAKDDTTQALSTLDQAIQEDPNDATANLTYGTIMAGIGSKEKAIEALTNLQKTVSIHTRNRKLFQVVAKLATIAEEANIAATAQQNVDQLKDLESQFHVKLSEVVGTREGTQARIELGDLAAATGHFQLARSFYQSAAFLDQTLDPAVDAKIQALFGSHPPLVQLGNTGEAAGTDAPADRAPESTSESAPEKSATSEPDDAVTPDESAKDGSNATDASTELAPN